MSYQCPVPGCPANHASKWELCPGEWVLRSDSAQRHAMENPRPIKLPPHWLRCEFMKDGERCAKGTGHPGDHEVPK